MASTPPRPPPTTAATRRGSSTRPSLLGATQLSQRRLRSNSGSGAPLDVEELLSRELTTAEVNSIAPPNPVYKIVLTGVSSRLLS